MQTFLKLLKQVQHKLKTCNSSFHFPSLHLTLPSPPSPPLAGQAERVEAMLRECPALAKAKTKDGVTPLMRAANKGYVKVCHCRTYMYTHHNLLLSGLLSPFLSGV